jgi:CRP-like cAMP-binding protein
MNSSTERQQPRSSEFQENLGILRQIQFFSSLPLEALKVFAYLCTRETFRAGDYLFHQDDNDGKAFYILSGEAELVRRDGGGELLLRHYGEGDFSGSLALIGDMRRLFSMKALTDMACLILTRDKFVKAIEQFSDVMPKILATVVTSIRDWEDRLFIDQDGLCEACKQKVGVTLI